ncbi:MAG: ABC transporter substrate-binding protein [Geminicoccaceae bacterium]|nr:MAG: ABC transporter substrate-binding protein [Geminicoccaceae bacterium]
MRWNILLVAALSLGLGLGAAEARTTLTIGIQQEPPVLDPTLDATAAIAVITAHNVFEKLVSVAEDGSIVPALAHRFEVSDDGLRYVFHLHDDVVFHDGAPFDASNVVFSFERAMDTSGANPQRQSFAFVEKVEALDPLTVQITLSRPDAFFLFNMAQAQASIFSPETVATNATRPVGTGPYRFVAWSRGDRLTLERFEGHRDAGDVAIERVTFRFIADPTAAVAALLAGEIDAFPGMPAPEALARLERDPRFDVVVGTTEGEVILAFNHGRPPLDDLRVRRAISHALDRQAIIDGAYYGYGEPIGSFFPPHHRAYVDLTGLYPHDPARARALLAEAGVEELRLSLRVPTFPYARRSAEIVQAQLAEVGIRVALETVEWGYWISEIFGNRNYDMTIIAHTSPNDLGNFARGPEYYWAFHDPAFDALWERVREATDPAEMDRLLQRAQRFVAAEAVHGFLFQLPQLGVYRQGLTGYRVSSPVIFAPLGELAWE